MSLQGQHPLTDSTPEAAATEPGLRLSSGHRGRSLSRPTQTPRTAHGGGSHVQSQSLLGSTSLV